MIGRNRGGKKEKGSYNSIYHGPTDMLSEQRLEGRQRGTICNTWERGFQAGVKCQSHEVAMCLGAIVAGTEKPVVVTAGLR